MVGYNIFVVRVYIGFFFNLGWINQWFRYNALRVRLGYIVVCSAVWVSGEHWTGKDFQTAFSS